MLTNTPIRLCLQDADNSSNIASPTVQDKNNFLPEIKKSIKFQQFHPFPDNQSKVRQQQLKSLPEIQFKTQNIHHSQSMGQLDEMQYDRVQIIKNKKKSRQQPKQGVSLKYEYSNTTHPNKELYQESFSNGFLSARIRNDIYNQQLNKSPLTNAQSEEKKQSQLLMYSMNEPKQLQRQSIIQQAWNTHYSPIYPTKTSQSERKKKYKQTDIINKADVKASSAIQDIKLRVQKEKEKEELADKQSLRARKLYKMYKQYF